jgi:multimeric flavodoxin WrbA
MNLLAIPSVYTDGMETTFILGVNGSPHKEGVVCELLNLILRGAAEAGAKTKIIHLYDLNIIHEPGHYSQNPKKAIPAEMPLDGITELYPEILRADGLVFATPVYWANMSGVMKDFIDHLTPLENDGFQLEGKVAAFIAASKENEGGLEMAVMSMVTALAQMGVLIPPNSVMWYPGGWSTTNKKVNSWAKEDAPKVGRNMVKLIKILKKNKIEWSS